ncbi:MAG TPA: SOS response-associated peptidase [Hyphomicrobiaceae bacterium]|nr:SOS response-associated peptidase [Hyphomicrobiaceae bacterium]
MCGRITQKSNPNILGLKITTMVEPLYADNTPPRYNGAPGQEHWVIRQDAKTGARSLDRLWWGLIPYWCKDESRARKPINAKSETIATLASFRDAYRRRRCLLPIDNFFEWKAMSGAAAKQPYAIGMRSGEPFALAAIWDSWQRPGTSERVRSFAVVTCPANDVIAEIHDRMPVIIAAAAYDQWLAPLDPDPRGLLAPYPSAPMMIWPITTRVNKPANDDAEILRAVPLAPSEPRLL